MQYIQVFDMNKICIGNIIVIIIIAIIVVKINGSKRNINNHLWKMLNYF